MSTEFNMARHIRVFRKIRDARSELSKKFKEEDEVLKAQQEAVGNAILGFLNATGQKTAATSEGTAFWQTKIIPRADDWDKFYQWIAATNNFEALERRVKSTFIKEYMDTNGDELPPGITVLSEREIRVRENNSK